MFKGDKEKEKMVTKVVRFKIIKPISPIEDWTEFSKIVKQIQEEVRLTGNRVITSCNLHYHNIITFGKPLAEEKWIDTYNKKIRSYIYEVCTTNCPSLGSKSAGSIGEEIFSKYFSGQNSYVKMMKKGDGNPPMSFTKEPAIPVVAQGTEIIKEDNGYYSLLIPLISNNFKKEWNQNHSNKFEKCFMKIGIQVKDYQKSILEKCISGEYKIGGSKLLATKDKKNKNILCFNLTYSFKPEKNNKLDINNVCGIDLGVNIPAYAAVNYNKYARFYIGDSTIIKEKLKLKKITKQLQRDMTYGTIGDAGHGIKTKVSDVTKAKDRVSNLTDTKNSQWAKALVDWAVKMKCGKLQLEDLSGFNKKYASDNFLKHWTYFDLQQKIEHKCNEHGIIVEKVSPKYTSQRCSECGFTSPDNRPKETKGQAYFKCCQCGHEENADFNAAKNIAKIIVIVKE